MKQQAAANSRRRRKRRWLQLLASASGDLTTTIYTAAHDYQHEQQQQNQVVERRHRVIRRNTSRRMVAISTLCMSVIVCITLSSIMSHNGNGCHAAPGTLDLVSKLAHRGGSSSSPGPHSSSSSSSSNSASHLVKSARLATYSLSCPPEASIHPCTCIYHTPGAGIESEEEEEEIYELSPAITTPYAEPLVQTTTPAASAPTTARPTVASSPSNPVNDTDKRTKADPSPSASEPATTTSTSTAAMTTTTTTTTTTRSTTTTTTTVAPTQSASTQPDESRDAQIGNDRAQQQAEPSFVVTSTTHEPRATSTTPLAEQQQASTRAPALKTTSTTTTTPVDGTTATTTKVTAHSGGGGGAQVHSKESIAENIDSVRPQQSEQEATTTSAPLTSGHGLAESVQTPVAIQQTNSSASLSSSVESVGGQESRNGAVASSSSSSSSVSLSNSSSLGQASAVGQQQEAVASEKRPAQNLAAAAADQKIPAQQSLDSLAPLPFSSSQPQPELEPYQPPLVQPAPLPTLPGSIAELPVGLRADEQRPEHSKASEHMTNVNQTGKQTNLELDDTTTATTTSARVISPAPATATTTTAKALEQAQPLVAETTEIPLRLTPSSTATIWTETRPTTASPVADDSRAAHTPQLRLTSGGGGPFVSEVARPTTTPMPLQTTLASVATSSNAAGISVASLPSSVVGSSNSAAAPPKVEAVDDETRPTNESGRTPSRAPTTPDLELSGARNDKQEVVTSPRPVAAPAPQANNATGIQTENNGNETRPASPISSSAVPSAVLNETKHDYNVVRPATVAGVESTNSAEQQQQQRNPVKMPPTSVISNSSATIHEVSLASAQAIESGKRLDLGPARADSASTVRPVTLADTSAATSATTVAPTTASVTNQSPSTSSAPATSSAPTNASGQSRSGQRQSNASESSAAAASTPAPATVAAPVPVQSALVSSPSSSSSSQVQSVKPQQPVPNSSSGNYSANQQQPVASHQSQAGAVDQTNPPAPPSPTHTIHRPAANNGTTHRAGPPPSNSSAPRAPGERPASAGRAIHHKPLIVGGSGNNNNSINSTTSHQHNQTAVHPNQTRPATHSNNNNHQSLAATAAQNGRQILTPNTHRPKAHASSRPTAAAGNHNNHRHHINSSGNSLGGRELPQAAGSSAAVSSGPPLRRSTRSAGNSGARPMHAQIDRTGGNRSPPPQPQPHPAKLQQRLTPNTLAAQASRRPNVLVTSTPNANPQFTNSSNVSQRAPGGRRLTRFLSHEHHSGNSLSAQDPFADASEQKVEVVAYCRNIQNMQVLRSAIKGFRGHQVNYFVIDSCKVPPFPNDLFHGIDVRWLEMSNSTVQFHNNFLHGAHHNQQGQLT